MGKWKHIFPSSSLCSFFLGGKKMENGERREKGRALMSPLDKPRQSNLQLIMFKSLLFFSLLSCRDEKSRAHQWVVMARFGIFRWNKGRASIETSYAFLSSSFMPGRNTEWDEFLLLQGIFLKMNHFDARKKEWLTALKVDLYMLMMLSSGRKTCHIYQWSLMISIQS